jgi:hypothetical protein
MVTDMTFLSKVGSDADAEAGPIKFRNTRTLVALRAISAWPRSSLVEEPKWRRAA